MGRKIPGKKHRGVKDPLKQQFEKKQKLKLVVNAPPSNPNIQEIPKSVLELNHLRQLVKSGKIHKRKKRGKNLLDTAHFSNVGPKLPGFRQEDTNIPRLKQKPGESDEAFLWRLDLATHEVINEAQMAAKHDVLVDRDSTGEVVNVKPGKISTEEGNKKGNQKKKNEKYSNKITGSKRKLERLKEKKELKKAFKNVKLREQEIEKQKDFIKFGEVVHQPPNISKRPRGSDLSSCDRPGQKNLLLKKLLDKKEVQSMSDRKHIATAREEAMRVYKMMKSKNKYLEGSKF